MPDPFYDDYQHELPKKCFLTDSVGTKFGVLILKWELEGSFSEGIYNILEHYGLPDGAWLRMTYEGKGEFFINSVSDRKFKEVKYPVPPKFYKFPFDIIPEEYFSSMPPELQIDEADLNQPVNFDNLRTWEITLTSKQVTHNNMVCCMLISFFLYISYLLCIYISYYHIY